MLGLLRWTFWITVWVIVGAFFHYTLLQTDIVRISNTLESRENPTKFAIFWGPPDMSADGTELARDVFFIQTLRPNGNVMVYRNEDTGWGWPPYFKFDTANLQTEFSDLKSTAETPRFVAIKHYGWRNELMSIYPNAISVRPVAGPEGPKGIPWLNIIILTVLAALVYGVWVRWRRFRRMRIDPTMEAFEDDLTEKGDAISRWMGSWRKKS
jgi:hypothetical protein